MLSLSLTPFSVMTVAERKEGGSELERERRNELRGRETELARKQDVL